MKKKTVKKMLSAALVGAMVLSLAACGSKGDSKDEGGDSKDGVTLEFQQWWGVEQFKAIFYQSPISLALP